MGNSRGVIIPKPILAQVGLVDEAEMTIEDGAIVLRRSQTIVRTGWADAAQQIAEAGDDILVMPEFDNANDEDLEW